MRRLALAAALAALAAGCGGKGEPARLKGRLVENGGPREFAPFSASVEVFLLGGDGQPDKAKSFTAPVGGDGTFEVVASGGTLPPGEYEVQVHLPAAKGKAATKVVARRELKPGPNDVTIDLAKPNG